MKLSSIEIKNYRSVYAGGGKPLRLELSAGMNALAGPNNCGKSNLLRAVALALDPDLPFSRRQDIPEQMHSAVPRITLEFQQTQRNGPEATLFRRAERYERSVLDDNRRSFAQDGIIRYQVTFPGNEESGATRQDILVIRGLGARQGDQALLKSALSQFREVVRFVMVESGSNLEELLAGKFRDALHTVIGWHLSDELESARKRHGDYIAGLQDDLLAPLASHITDEVRDLFPEIVQAELIPDVRSIEETLEKVAVRLTDDAVTDLSRKGTGVRGGVLVAMLRYLAEQSRRSLVFAIEEPEAFLHPAAQENLRDDLEALAVRDDVTAIITTHSPYIVSRSDNARLVAIEKDTEGRTRIKDSANGAESHHRLLGGLFRDSGVARVLDRATCIPAHAAGILLVEGTTDVEYLQLATQVAGRTELIADLHIVPTHGAKEAVLEAIVTRALTSRPLLVLLDSDEMGREVFNRLAGRTLRFDKKRDLLTYAAAYPKLDRGIAVEAEDLFPAAALHDFVAHYGYGKVCSDKQKIPRINRWHYDLNRRGKELLPTYLRSRITRPQQVSTWITLIERIRQQMGLPPTALSDERPLEARRAHWCSTRGMGTARLSTHNHCGRGQRRGLRWGHDATADATHRVRSRGGRRPSTYPRHPDPGQRHPRLPGSRPGRGRALGPSPTLTVEGVRAAAAYGAALARERIHPLPA